MTESVLSNLASKSNRLDPPHDLLSSSAVEAAVSADGASGQAAENPWMAYAGRDPDYTTQQVDRQASELLSYVQEQNKEIDVRQAELNAKLAQLDNQLRNARLRSIDDSGTDLLSAPPKQAASDAMLDSGLELDQLTTAPKTGGNAAPSDGFAVADLGYAQEEVTTRVSHFHSAHKLTEPSNQEFEEVEQIVAQFTDSDDTTNDGAIEDLWNHDPDLHFDEHPPQVSEHAAQPTVERQTQANPKSAVVPNEVNTPTGPQQQTPPVRDQVDAFPSMLAGSHLRRVDTIHFGDTDSLESERRLLADRKLELDRQKSVVSRMQEETQALHREALEMRIVTEQLWSQLSNATHPEKLAELIASLRARLDEQYAHEQSTLEQRKDEIVSMQELLTEKQTSLREQSGRMQEWFSSRQEEIKAYANEVDARAMLLDRREHRLQDEFAKWESQRKAYEQQLQGLVQKLKLNGISM